MVINSSLLIATYSRQSLAPILIHMFVRCCISLVISWDAHIYETLTWTPKVIKKIKCYRTLDGTLEWTWQLVIFKLVFILHMVINHSPTMAIGLDAIHLSHPHTLYMIQETVCIIFNWRSFSMYISLHQ